MAKPKKVKLTPEEKKALQAEKKRLKKLMAEEKERQIKRDRLQREINYSEQNRKKLVPIWRQMLINIALKNIGIEFQCAVNAFGKILDSKDYTISLLLDELNAAHEQNIRNIYHQCRQMENTYRIYRQRLHELKENYVHDVAELKKKWETEAKEHVDSCEEKATFLKEMTFGLYVVNKNIDKIDKSEYLSKLDAEEEHAINVLNLKKHQIERKFETMWNAYNNLVTSFLIKTEQRSKEYKIINTQDIDMRNIIKNQSQQLFKVQVLAMKAKENNSKIKDDFEEIKEKLKKEKTYFAKAVNFLRKDGITLQEHDKKQLMFLVTVSNDVIKNLEILEKKSVKILTYMQVSRKFETVREKIFPFPNYKPYKELSTTSLPEQAIDRDIFNNMETLWKKIGQCDVKRYQLNEERGILKKSNAILKRKMLNMCRATGFTCRLPKIEINSLKKKALKKNENHEVKLDQISKMFL